MEILRDLAELLEAKSISNFAENNLHLPVLFRPGQNSDQLELADLLEAKPQIKVSDTIYSQLRELAKSKHPELKLSESEINELVSKHVGYTPLYEYGVWVYYPWGERLVHILDATEFIDLRTNRNKYKITQEEQDQLQQKKIGVIGLSVGQSVSLTLAMERGFGELRIADFDELEITNLNRLRSGIHNMGIKKTILVAREIAEIDPFLKVTCFHDGITDENIETFLLENGKLDLLIDECDGVDVKINCRLKARKHQIPVLMEASDRGTIDIERFDLEPHRPILHGFVEHLDVTKVKGLKTNEEKLPYILPIVGIETMSVRLKASAVEVGKSISTWPQLASAVTMGGGITADISRKILLDQLHLSGRFFIDLDELIADEKKPVEPFIYNTELLTEDLVTDIIQRVKIPAEENDIRDEQVFEELVTAAALAPSAGNNQPWEWHSYGSKLYLFHALEKSVSFGDYENMASYMAFGTAIENLKLKASEINVEPVIHLFPLADEPRLIAAIKIKKRSLPVKEDELVKYLGIRVTNRSEGQCREINRNILAEIENSTATIPEVSVRIVEDKDRIHKLADIMGKAEKLRLFIPQGHYDLFEKEMRWTPEYAEQTRDGLDITTLDLSPKDAVGFRIIRDAEAIKLVKELKGGKALEEMTGKLAGSASALGLITTSSFTKNNCIKVGQAAERVWLTANKNEVSLQPILASILHFARINYGGGKEIADDIREEFITLNRDFKSLFELSEFEKPMFLFRLFYSESPKVRSLRRDLNKVYFKHVNKL